VIPFSAFVPMFPLKSSLIPLWYFSSSSVLTFVFYASPALRPSYSLILLPFTHSLIFFNTHIFSHSFWLSSSYVPSFLVNTSHPHLFPPYPLQLSYSSVISSLSDFLLISSSLPPDILPPHLFHHSSDIFTQLFPKFPPLHLFPNPSLKLLLICSPMPLWYSSSSSFLLFPSETHSAPPHLCPYSPPILLLICFLM
jgi:hypothetical protein